MAVLRKLGVGQVGHRIAEVELEAHRIVRVEPFQVLVDQVGRRIAVALVGPFQVLVGRRIAVALVGPFQVLAVQEAYLPVACHVDLQPEGQHCHPAEQNA